MLSLILVLVFGLDPPVPDVAHATIDAAQGEYAVMFASSAPIFLDGDHGTYKINETPGGRLDRITYAPRWYDGVTIARGRWTHDEFSGWFVFIINDREYTRMTLRGIWGHGDESSPPVGYWVSR